MHSVILLSICWSSAVSDADLRAEIDSLLPARGFTTAHFGWTLTFIGGINDGLVERFETQIAGDSILESNFGDEQGFHEFQLRTSLPASQIAPGEVERLSWPRELSAGTRNTLLLDGSIWSLPTVERPVTGKVGVAGTRPLKYPVDITRIGLTAVWDSNSSNWLHLPDQYFEEFANAEIHEGRDGRFRTLSLQYGTRRLTWWLDANRGHQPVRALLESADASFWSESELREIGGVWVPDSVRFYRGDDPQPYRILDVKKASFDESWHRQHLRPIDVGALYGTAFTDFRGSGPVDESGFVFWDGSGLVSADEYWQLVYGFGIYPDEKVIEGLAARSQRSAEEYVRLQYEGEYASRVRNQLGELHLAKFNEEPPWVTSAKVKQKDEWDVFVEEFIEKHNLTDKAAERAGKILEAAKKLRNANRFRLKNAERENERRLIDRYKEREELIYKERLVAPLEEMAKSESAKKEEVKSEGQ